jgi:hypothetical protein
VEDGPERVLGEAEPAQFVESVLDGDGSVVGDIHVLDPVETNRTDTRRR